MAIVRKGNTSILFGAAGVSADGIAIVTGYSVRREYALNVEGRGPEGEVEAWVLGSEKFMVTVEGYCSSATPPALGGTVTLAGVNATITNVEVQATNEDFAKCRVECTYHAGAV